VLATTHADVDVLRVGDQLYLVEGSDVSESVLLAGLPRHRRRDIARS